MLILGLELIRRNTVLKRLPHVGLYDYNRRQIKLFLMKWFVDRLTGPAILVIIFWNFIMF